MKKLRFGLLVLLFSVPVIAIAATAPKSGDGCSKVNQVAKVGSDSFKCSLVWVKTSVASTSQPSSTPTTSSKLQSKSFRLESIEFTNEYFFGANARISNISSKTKTAIFTVTVFAQGTKKVLGTLTGSAQSVASGETVTVQMIGTSDSPSGTYSYAFQVDLEY